MKYILGPTVVKYILGNVVLLVVLTFVLVFGVEVVGAEVVPIVHCFEVIGVVMILACRGLALIFEVIFQLALIYEVIWPCIFRNALRKCSNM